MKYIKKVYLILFLILFLYFVFVNVCYAQLTRPILVVLYDVNDVSSQIYLKALNDNNLKYNIWDIKTNNKRPTYQEYIKYKQGVVIRIVNSNFENFSALTLDEISDLMEFMGSNGSLLLIGQNMGNDFYNSPMLSYLKIDIQNKDYYPNKLYGVSNEFISQGLNFIINSDNNNNKQTNCDVIIPYDNVEPILYYDEAKKQVAAMKLQTCAYKACYFGFGIEGIGDEKARSILLYRAIDWLLGNNMMVGVIAPNFILKTLNDENTSFNTELEHLVKDKICLLQFFATWCSHCAEFRPKLAKIYSKYKDKIEVIAVSYNEKPEVIKKYIQTYSEVTWNIFIDESGQGLIKYGVKGIPAVFLIEPNERRVRYIGGNEDVETISNEIEKILFENEQLIKIKKLENFKK